MNIDPTLEMFLNIFMPEAIPEIMKVADEDLRFAYYTSADTAMKIIQNGELWLRNVTVMNDFREVSYGLDLIYKTLSEEAGEAFRTAVDGIFSGTIAQVDHLLNQWVSDWELETYIACVSKHEDSEDQDGRLSMWRAYGNTALIVRNAPMLATTDDLGVFSLPVIYQSQKDYENRLNAITRNITNNTDYLRGLGQDVLVDYLKEMFFRTAIGSKHPGFSEEKEWRLYYRPTERKRGVLEEKAFVVSGVSQIVYVLPLKHDPDNGLHNADIPSLLERIIIGPTSYPYVSFRAFSKILSDAGVADGTVKVITSGIPLRTE